MLPQPLLRNAFTSCSRCINYCQRRTFKEYYLTKELNGHILRLKLANAKQLVGITSSRGTRPENEDQCRGVTLELPEGHHLRSLRRDANRVYFGIFDGHGGPVVAEWLAKNLHEFIETVSLDDLSQTLKSLQAYGGYFKRFPIPSALQGSVDHRGNTREDKPVSDLSVEQRLILGFLKADVECLKYVRDERNDIHLDHEGSTGSVAIIEPVDERPFWDSESYDIVIGHVGDTRILLCDASTGKVITLTTGDHHPNNPSELERLRKYAGFITTDSWGDERMLGMLATSRAFGDARLKRYGVSAEPDVVRYTITKSNPAAFLVLVTDGVTSVMSDQEIVDMVKQNKDPAMAAKKLVDTADQLQTEDNVSAIVVRLRNWGRPMYDFTRDLRAYRLENASMSSRQSW